MDLPASRGCPSKNPGLRRHKPPAQQHTERADSLGTRWESPGIWEDLGWRERERIRWEFVRGVGCGAHARGGWFLGGIEGDRGVCMGG